MNISRFFGATNREVLRQVRLALGPDALIISNKRVNGGVEILATDQTSVPEPAAPQGAVAPAAPPAPAMARPPQTPAPAPAPAADLLGAIGDLKGTLESRIDELLWGNQLRQSPQAVTLFQTLLRFGFSTALLRAMLKRMPAQPTARAALLWARGELVKHLPVLSSEDALWQPGLALALVGPTGVGKTTTIAKLAARCVRRGGAGSLVLLTTDTYRIGAHEQLKIYGQMLHVPVHVVQDVHELRRVLQTVRPDQTVLIDNVGISQRDRYIADQAALLAGAGRKVERLLALNASSQGDTLDDVARSYSNDGGTPLRGCVITKVDEASCLGAALDAALRYQLPIHYVSNGQRVPENLLFLSPLELVDRALVPVQGNRTLYAPTEADLAALLSATRPPESPETQAERRRQQVLLPRLLTHSPDDLPLAMSDLQGAVAGLDDDLVLSEAYDLWQSRVSGHLPSAAETVTHLGQVVRSALGESGRAWVVHDRQSFSRSGRGASSLGSFWFAEAGSPLAAGLQQVGVGDGWYAPGGASLQPPSAADAWMAQVASVPPDASACHVLEGGSHALLLSLERAGCRWLSACGARARVQGEEGAAVVSAVARRLDHRPLAPGVHAALRAPAGFAEGAVVWWAGQGQVELQARGADTLPASLVSLRAVDPQTGRVLRAWYALAAADSSIDARQAARALVLRQECHAFMRGAPGRLAADTGREPLIDRAVYWAQLGCAAWHLTQGAALAPVARVVARMMGAERLAARQAHAGLMKLFALKELLTQ